MQTPESDDLLAVRAGYDRWSSVYDHDLNPLPALEEHHFQRAVGDPSGKTAIDLGCGTGRHASWLSDAGASVTGVDFSEGMLRQARLKPGADRIRFVEHDLHRELPFADSSFDLAVSGLVLEHIRDLPGFFRMVRRVIRPGGRAVVSAMHPAMYLRGSMARFTDPSSGLVVAPGSLRHKLSQLIMAPLRAGFVLDAIDEYSPDEPFVVQFPRAQKYLGWPMLVVLQLRVTSPATIGRG